MLSDSLRTIFCVAVTFTLVTLSASVVAQTSAPTETVLKSPPLQSFSWPTDRTDGLYLLLHVAVAEPRGQAWPGADGFADRLLKAIDQSRDLSEAKSCKVGESVRSLYCDIYPWVSDKRELFLTIAIFTDDDPVAPVFVNDQSPLSAPIADADKLCERAAKTIADAIHQKRQTGWPRLPTTRPAAESTTQPAALPAVKKWKMLDPAGDTPPVRFRFAPPITDYGGFVRRFIGSLKIDNDSECSGRFVADVPSIDMGDRELTQSINEDVHLDTVKFPTAVFNLEQLTAPTPDIDRHLSAITLVGVFTMKDATVPLFARATRHYSQTADGAWRMRLRGSFRINIKDFGLWPPAGPEPANHTLIMEYDFVFAPD